MNVTITDCDLSMLRLAEKYLRFGEKSLSELERYEHEELLDWAARAVPFSYESTGFALQMTLADEYARYVKRTRRHYRRFLNTFHNFLQRIGAPREEDMI